MPLSVFGRRRTSTTPCHQRLKSPSSVSLSSTTPRRSYTDFVDQNCLPCDSSTKTCNVGPYDGKARLVGTLSEVLRRPDAIENFLEYMETVPEGSKLANFCAEVQMFQRSAENVSKCLAETAQRRQRQETETTSCDEEDHLPLSTDFILVDQTSGQPDSGEVSQRPKPSKKSPSTAPSIESFDSGIAIGQSETSNVEPTTSQGPPDQLSATEQLLLNQTREALHIYKKYLAPESDCELTSIPIELRHTCLDRICTESGNVDPDCFEEVSVAVKTEIEAKYFPKYLESKMYSRLLFSQLTSSEPVSIVDILTHEVLLFHLMEFVDKVEGPKGRQLVEFSINVKNFRQRNSKIDESAARNDAEIIFEKYIANDSILNLDVAIKDEIRSKLDEKESFDCITIFDEAFSCSAETLHNQYLSQFLQSSEFHSYITDLKQLIEPTATPLTNPRMNYNHSISINVCAIPEDENLSNCSEGGRSMSVDNSSVGDISISIPFPASPTPSFRDDLNESRSSFCEVFPFDSDQLWRRKAHKINNIGRVDSLGRYTSMFELPPEDAFFASPGGQASAGGMGSKISRAVRRMMMNSPSLEKDREEVAWQMAHMIVGQVMSRPTTPAKPKL